MREQRASEAARGSREGKTGEGLRVWRVWPFFRPVEPPRSPVRSGGAPRSLCGQRCVPTELLSAEDGGTRAAGVRDGCSALSGNNHLFNEAFD